jgi:hypothetical protein
MSLIAKNKDADFTPVPQGTHLAVCYLLVDCGLQINPFKPTKKQAKIVIGWELPEELMEDGRPQVISSIYSVSLHKKSTLRRDLESWRGKEFTEEELEGFDLRNVVAKGCLITVTHNVTDERTYANVKGVTALPRGMSAPLPVNPVMIYDMEKANEDVLVALPQWIQEMVKKGERPGDAEAENERVQQDIADTTNSVAPAEIPF